MRPAAGAIDLRLGGGLDGQPAGVDAAVRNLADAGDQPALDGERIGHGSPGAGLGGRRARRGTGQAGEGRSQRRLALPRADRGRPASAPARPEPARGPIRESASPASCCERLRCCVSKRASAMRRSPRAVRLARERGARLLGLIAQAGAAAPLRRGARRCGGGFRAWSPPAASGRGSRRAPSRAGRAPARRGGGSSSAAPRSGGSPAPAARRDARAARAWSAAISAIRRSDGGDVGFRRLDPRRQRLRRHAGAVGIIGRPLRRALELPGSAACACCASLRACCSAAASLRRLLRACRSEGAGPGNGRSG